MGKKAKHGRTRKSPLLKRPALQGRPFAVRPAGFRGARTAPADTIEKVVPPWFAAKYPLASLIEYLVYMWLVRVDHRTAYDGNAGTGDMRGFGYQVPALGGRTAGGQVIDFVVYGPRPIALLCNGGYWHFGGLTRTYQDSVRARNDLTNLGYLAVMIWEADLLTSLDGTMQKALAGVEAPLALSVMG